ncbi:Major viral transcription factor [Cacatuid alphaherpesvirus 2]|uniref:Major viral transcription factor n=1 Tax=Cacatuid alphaherpesvirus 2 TaxID=2604840 RepID=A0A5B9QZS9_9ALPH|nr:Major viral transcription factor [Cacatuid alphaherpesvirus 2]QEG54038.1 Major viral transcription factor [Cacatuid alphaherpesvirus 2]
MYRHLHGDRLECGEDGGECLFPDDRKDPGRQTPSSPTEALLDLLHRQVRELCQEELCKGTEPAALEEEEPGAPRAEPDYSPLLFPSPSSAQAGASTAPDDSTEDPFSLLLKAGEPIGSPSALHQLLFDIGGDAGEIPSMEAGAAAQDATAGEKLEACEEEPLGDLLAFLMDLNQSETDARGHGVETDEPMIISEEKDLNLSESTLTGDEAPYGDRSPDLFQSPPPYEPTADLSSACRGRSAEAFFTLSRRPPPEYPHGENPCGRGQRRRGCQRKRRKRFSPVAAETAASSVSDRHDMLLPAKPPHPALAPLWEVLYQWLRRDGTALCREAGAPDDCGTEAAAASVVLPLPALPALQTAELTVNAISRALTVDLVSPGWRVTVDKDSLPAPPSVGLVYYGKTSFRPSRADHPDVCQAAARFAYGSTAARVYLEEFGLAIEQYERLVTEFMMQPLSRVSHSYGGSRLNKAEKNLCRICTPRDENLEADERKRSPPDKDGSRTALATGVPHVLHAMADGRALLTLPHLMEVIRVCRRYDAAQKTFLLSALRMVFAPLVFPGARPPGAGAGDSCPRTGGSPLAVCSAALREGLRLLEPGADLRRDGRFEPRMTAAQTRKLARRALAASAHFLSAVKACVEDEGRAGRLPRALRGVCERRPDLYRSAGRRPRSLYLWERALSQASIALWAHLAAGGPLKPSTGELVELGDATADVLAVLACCDDGDLRPSIADADQGWRALAVMLDGDPGYAAESSLHVSAKADAAAKNNGIYGEAGAKRLRGNAREPVSENDEDDDVGREEEERAAEENGEGEKETAEEDEAAEVKDAPAKRCWKRKTEADERGEKEEERADASAGDLTDEEAEAEEERMQRLCSGAPPAHRTEAVITSGVRGAARWRAYALLAPDASQHERRRPMLVDASAQTETSQPGLPEKGGQEQRRPAYVSVGVQTCNELREPDPNEARDPEKADENRRLARRVARKRSSATAMLPDGGAHDADETGNALSSSDREQGEGYEETEEGYDGGGEAMEAEPAEETLPPPAVAKLRPVPEGFVPREGDVVRLPAEPGDPFLPREAAEPVLRRLEARLRSLGSAACDDASVKGQGPAAWLTAFAADPIGLAEFAKRDTPGSRSGSRRRLDGLLSWTARHPFHHRYDLLILVSESTPGEFRERSYAAAAVAGRAVIPGSACDHSRWPEGVSATVIPELSPADDAVGHEAAAVGTAILSASDIGFAGSVETLLRRSLEDARRCCVVVDGRSDADRAARTAPRFPPSPGLVYLRVAPPSRACVANLPSRRSPAPGPKKARNDSPGRGPSTPAGAFRLLMHVSPRPLFGAAAAEAARGRSDDDDDEAGASQLAFLSVATLRKLRRIAREMDPSWGHAALGEEAAVAFPALPRNPSRRRPAFLPRPPFSAGSLETSRRRPAVLGTDFPGRGGKGRRFSEPVEDEAEETSSFAGANQAEEDYDESYSEDAGPSSPGASSVTSFRSSRSLRSSVTDDDDDDHDRGGVCRDVDDDDCCDGEGEEYGLREPLGGARGHVPAAVIVRGRWSFAEEVPRDVIEAASDSLPRAACDGRPVAVETMLALRDQRRRTLLASRLNDMGLGDPFCRACGDRDAFRRENACAASLPPMDASRDDVLPGFFLRSFPTPPRHRHRQRQHRHLWRGRSRRQISEAASPPFSTYFFSPNPALRPATPPLFLLPSPRPSSPLAARDTVRDDTDPWRAWRAYLLRRRGEGGDDDDGDDDDVRRLLWAEDVTPERRRSSSRFSPYGETAAAASAATWPPTTTTTTRRRRKPSRRETESAVPASPAGNTERQAPRGGRERRRLGTGRAPRSIGTLLGVTRGHRRESYEPVVQVYSETSDEEEEEEENRSEDADEWGRGRGGRGRPGPPVSTGDPVVADEENGEDHAPTRKLGFARAASVLSSPP